MYREDGSGRTLPPSYQPPFFLCVGSVVPVTPVTRTSPPPVCNRWVGPPVQGGSGRSSPGSLPGLVSLPDGSQEGGWCRCRVRLG